MKKYSKESFCDILKQVDWSPILSCLDTNLAWLQFKNIFTKTLDTIAPKKSIRIKQRSAPWITPTILEKITLRDFYLSEYIKDKTKSDIKILYCKLRNEIQREINLAKSNYLQVKLEDNMSKPKKLWESLKSLGYSNKSKDKSNIVLRISDKLCFKTSDICNYVNEFFTTIASKLVSKLPPPKNQFDVDSQLFKNFYHEKGIQPGAYKLSAITQDFVFKELNSMNPQKATGMDNISPKFLKDSASIIAPTVTHIINLSITSGQVPDDLKIAKVTPLYKKNDKLEVGNYRHISVLSAISKVLEKSVYIQIQKYLHEQDLIY